MPFSGKTIVKTPVSRLRFNMFEICTHTETALLIAFSRDAAEKLRAFGEYSAALILEDVAYDMEAIQEVG